MARTVTRSENCSKSATAAATATVIAATATTTTVEDNLSDCVLLSCHIVQVKVFLTGRMEQSVEQSVLSKCQLAAAFTSQECFSPRILSHAM